MRVALTRGARALLEGQATGLEFVRTVHEAHQSPTVGATERQFPHTSSHIFVLRRARRAQRMHNYSTDAEQEKICQVACSRLIQGRCTEIRKCSATEFRFPVHAVYITTQVLRLSLDISLPST